MLCLRAGLKRGRYGVKDYGLKDFEAEFIRTPAQKLAFECAIARLLIGQKKDFPGILCSV